MLLQSVIFSLDTGQAGLPSVVVVVIFYFSSQDAQANLPSRRGRDVPSSHKTPTWCDDRGKKGIKKTRVSHKRHEDANVGENSIILLVRLDGGLYLLAVGHVTISTLAVC